jgi:mannosyltransferase
VSAAPAGHRGGATAPATPAGGAPAPAAPAGPAAGPAASGSRRPSLAGLYGAIATVAATMAVLGWWGLARRDSMGNDEVATRWAALLPLHELFRLLSHVDAVHGLYYLLMHPWVAAGSTPAILRIPSVIAMMVAGALTVLLGRQLTGSVWAGLIAGLVMVLTPAISFYAQTARSYAMVLACVVGTTMALLSALRAEAAGLASVRRRWAGYAVLVALGAYLNEMTLLVLAAHGITVLLARPGQPVVRRWLAAGIAGAVLAIPILALSLIEHGAIGWIGYPNWPAIRPLLDDYFGTTAVAILLLAVCIVPALLPVREAWPQRFGGQPGPTAPLPWWRSGGVSLPSVALPLLLGPAILLIAESLVLKPLYVDRYVLYGEAGAALLAGGGAYRIGGWLRDAAARRRGIPAGQAAGGWRALAWVPGLVLCAGLLVFQLGPQQHIRTPGSRAYDFGGPSHYIGANARKGDGILYFGTLYRKAELGYPGDFPDTTDFAMAESPRKAGNFRGRDKPFTLTGPLMLHYRRIWVYGLRPSLKIPPGPLRDESIELFRDYTLAGVHRFKGITVTLWVRR